MSSIEQDIYEIIKLFNESESIDNLSRNSAKYINAYSKTNTFLAEIFLRTLIKDKKYGKHAESKLKIIAHNKYKMKMNAPLKKYHINYDLLRVHRMYKEEICSDANHTESDDYNKIKEIISTGRDKETSKLFFIKHCDEKENEDLIEYVKEVKNQIDDQECKTRDYIQILNRIYLARIFNDDKSMIFRTFMNWEEKDFIDWYIKNDDACAYCKSKIHSLLKFYRPSKRSRGGLTFEIEKENPGGAYQKNNCKLICLYCNNAKSDTFKSKEEFQEVAEGIYRAIDKIVNK